MKNLRFGALALASLLVIPTTLAAAGPGPEEGTAAGQLVVGGRTTPLTHAWARAQRDPLEKSKERVLVVLSDAVLPPEEFLEQFPGLKLAAKGKAHVVTVELKDDKSVATGSILSDAFAASDAYCGAGTHVLAAKTFDSKVVEGKLAMPKAEEFEGKRVGYEATFRATVWHRPAPTATGVAAAQTAPGKAALAFARAATSGDKAATKRLLTPDAEAAKALDGPQAKDVLGMLGTINPRPDVAKVENVWVLGNGAEVTLSGKAGDGETSHTLILALVGNEWRVAQEMTAAWF